MARLPQKDTPQGVDFADDAADKAFKIIYGLNITGSIARAR